MTANFEEISVDTAIDTIDANVASTSKAASASDEIEVTSFRASSNQKCKGTLTHAATYVIFVNYLQ